VDFDLSASNSEIRYTRLTGDDPVVNGLRLDAATGEISVVNNQGRNYTTLSDIYSE
jgi:hypothetical protein